MECVTSKVYSSRRRRYAHRYTLTEQWAVMAAGMALGAAAGQVNQPSLMHQRPQQQPLQQQKSHPPSIATGPSGLLLDPGPPYNSSIHRSLTLLPDFKPRDSIASVAYGESTCEGDGDGGAGGESSHQPNHMTSGQIRQSSLHSTDSSGADMHEPMLPIAAHSDKVDRFDSSPSPTFQHQRRRRLANRRTKPGLHFPEKAKKVVFWSSKLALTRFLARGRGSSRRHR